MERDVVAREVIKTTNIVPKTSLRVFCGLFLDKSGIYPRKLSLILIILDPCRNLIYKGPHNQSCVDMEAQMTRRGILPRVEVPTVSAPTVVDDQQVDPSNIVRSSARGPNPPHRNIVPAAGDRPTGQRYISRRELRALFPVSDMTIFRWTRDPEVAFPAPVKLSPNGRNFWWLPAVRDWDHKRRSG
jgi:hypothetical protein